MKILGIDPGTALIGWGIIDTDSTGGKSPTAHAYGHITTGDGESLERRLVSIAKDITAIVQKYNPDEVGVEELFFFKNHKTAMSVAHARGVILLICAQHNIPLGEYTPLQIKQSVTNYGRADKKQVQKTVQSVLGLKEIPQPDDAADALAIALCHSYSRVLHDKTA